MQAPEWFTAALAEPVETGTFAVGGVDISYRAWGEAGREGLIFVHGGAAHARWWDHIAPQFCQQRRVVAIDLSGHGDSARREQYSLSAWADELLATPAATGITGKPVVVAHSMGGFVTFVAAVRAGEFFEGIMTIDSPVRELTPEESEYRGQRAFGPLRIYATKEEAISRFRPVPDQEVVLPYIGAHVAATSVRQLRGGWAWKFDPAIFAAVRVDLSMLTRLECRAALFRSEHGLVSEQMSENMFDRLGQVAPTIEIPAAGHAVMLDQPIALVTAVRTLLADWEHSVLLG